ncbi:hypothetical protein [Streptomyces sp. NPDC093094]|uniref:hypothetical protein n=1 Tax=Streptomyces sp. NPDC093094 TaxID=3366026 RepID=UPI00382524AC
MNLRLLALAGVAACAIALPLAVASAGPADDGERMIVRLPAPGPGPSRLLRTGAADEDDETDAKGPSAGPPRPPGGPGSHERAGAPLLLGLGAATAARCGPELSSPEGVEAQTCVLTQGEDTWARTYYRNATGETLQAVLSLMGPEGRTVQMRCAVGAGDEPASCETPRERTLGEAIRYTAVAEFAGVRPDGPLMLRSGSNP